MFADLKKLRSLAEAEGLDALVVNSSENFHLVTGFQSNVLELRGGGGAAKCFAILPVDENLDPALVTSDGDDCPQLRRSWIKDQKFFASGMYIENGGPTEKIYANSMDPLTEVLSERGLHEARLGVEVESMSAAADKELRKAFPKAKFTTCTGIMKELRAVKTKEAVDLIAEATRITDKATEALLDSVKVGATEMDLKKAFVETVTREGGDMYHPSHLIVHTSYGPVLHRVSQVIDYRLKDRDLVRVDAGAAFKGWTSDICRTAVAGTMSERNKKIYETIRTAQERVIENIRPGVTTSELFRIGQSYVREKGYPAYTRYMIGHSIGLELHEEPLIAPTNSRELQAGMVLAIEIPFYLRDSGGISVEDIVLVTEDGHRMISACTKEP